METEINTKFFGVVYNSGIVIVDEEGKLKKP